MSADNPLGITNKPEMSLKAGLGKGTNQTINATGKAAGTGVGVGAFKRKDMKLHGGPFHLWCVSASNQVWRSVSAYSP